MKGQVRLPAPRSRPACEKARYPRVFFQIQIFKHIDRRAGGWQVG
jgi:hypothetical protein